MNTKNIKFNKTGFSLIETIVVLFIVSVGLLAVLSLSIESAKSQSLNKNALVAAGLAQEGIELIRNVRDTNWRENSSSTPVAWNRYIEGSLIGEKYKIDYNTFIPTSTSSIDSAILYDSAGFYSHDTSSQPTIFKRMITIYATSSSASSSTIKSLVEWSDKGRSNKLELETILYDWK